MRTARCAVVAAALLAAAGAVAAPAPTYGTKGQCDGWPRVDLKTPPGSCVALVADAATGLRFPRRIVEVAPGRYWITDMGSWEPRRGRLLELTINESDARPAVSVQVLAEALDRPHGLVIGPDGKVYVGEAGRIWRTPMAVPLARETVVDGLPDDGAHPLKELAFGRDGTLFINVGSASDACRDAQGAQAMPCPETLGPLPRAAVWRAQLSGPAFTLQSLHPYATGLRNSVALAYVPGPGVLLQGENSIDYPDENDPPEELNLLREGSRHGWPACVGMRQVARGYEGRADCSRSERPSALWPAHAAPLHMLAVPASAGTAFGGQLLVAWHGHRAAGHRVVGFALDASGRPHGAVREWVSGWSAQPGVRPQGAPTGITVDSRGRLLIVEDRNRTLLMLVLAGAGSAR